MNKSVGLRSPRSTERRAKVQSKSPPVHFCIWTRQHDEWVITKHFDSRIYSCIHGRSMSNMCQQCLRQAGRSMGILPFRFLPSSTSIRMNDIIKATCIYYVRSIKLVKIGMIVNNQYQQSKHMMAHLVRVYITQWWINTTLTIYVLQIE
jgi:hypothetical protein